MANTDLVEWILYDSDLTTRLAILPVTASHLYLELDEPGSGELQIPLDTTAAAQITNGQFCMCYYRGSARSGFFVDNIKIVDADGNEGAGRNLSISGRGPLGLLDEAIVWQDGSGATERQYTDKSKAYILLDQISEAQARGALSVLSCSFTSTDDSTGTLWTDSEDLKFPVGTTLLDVARQFYKTGAMEFDISLSTTDFVLSAYKNGVGSNLTNSVFFRIGSNCVDMGSDERGDEIRNVYLTKFKDGFTTVSSTDSITTRRRREKFLSLEVAQSSESANTYASAKLTLDKDPHKSINVQVFDGVGPRLFVDYNIGDTVTLDKFGTEVTFRILGAQVDFNGEGFANVVLEMNWIARDDDDLDWLMKQWVTAHDADLTEIKAWLGFGQPDAPVNALLISGNYLYVGGEFAQITGRTAANYVARYNLTTGEWTPMGTGTTDTVVALAEFSGDIFAATSKDVSRWSSSDDAWISVGSSTDASGGVSCMTKAADDSMLYIGGQFVTFGTLPSIGGYSVIGWDGASWNGIAIPVATGTYICNALTLFNDVLYAGFTKPASTDPDSITFQQYDSGIWTQPIVDPIDSTGNSIPSMQQVGDALFYTDGAGVVYSWNGSDTDTADIIGTFNIGQPTANTALAGYLSDALIGGQFTTINGVSTRRITRYSGGVWSALGGGMGDGSVRAVTVNDSNVIAGGSFTTVDGKAIPYLAIWITNFNNLIDQLSKSSGYDLGAGIHSAAATTTLTDNDEFPLWKNTAQALRKVTYAYLKSNLTTYNDGQYLKLDGTNDPVTSQLDVVPAAKGDGGIYIQTTGDSYSLDVEQYTTTDNISATTPAIMGVQYTDGTGNIPSPLIQGIRLATGSGTITGDLLRFNIQGGAVLFQVLTDGSMRLPQIADASAVNDSVYYSTTASKVCYKDSGGTVHALY
jgi:hypothetical protein